jgi:hypothetical protein
LRTWLLLAAAWALAGCETTPRDFQLADGHAGATGVHTFAVAPLNLVVPLPAELETLVTSVARQVRIELEAQGRAVIRLSREDAYQWWRESTLATTDVKDPAEHFERAAAHMALLVAKRTEAEALLLSSLVYRQARHRYGNARWDGVVRSISGSVPPVEVMSAASLHVFVYDRQGVRVFEGFGGLVVAHRFDAEQGFVTRDDLSDAPKDVREGVSIALDPYLPRRY